MNYYAVIMAGGVGSRFWPKSRASKPKQFLDMLGLGESLLQMTYKRFAEILPEENILIVTNSDYYDLIKSQIPTIKDNQILGEPIAKNTAPCIAYAVSKIASKHPDATVVVAPSDHLILKQEAFLSRVKLAMDFCQRVESIVTLGIKPSRPDTGYGYIQFLDDSAWKEVFKVKVFTEKPSLEIAQNFIESGDFLWNAGIFISTVKTLKHAFETHLPEMYDLFAKGKSKYFGSKEKEFIDQIYPACQSISIDYGIIEKSDNVYVIPSEFGWSDLGTWKSLYEVADKNEEQNVPIGTNIELTNSKGNLVVSYGEKLVVLEGVNDLFVLDSEDALLVCNKENEQEVKRIVNEVKAKFKDKYI
ncbi:MAG: mannose-1-phosphate guanylyltransferase [Flavobacteriales bacterium]|nr:mannose-1-phosphate guanylyltransferase [Flavobacteriales bacterium]